MHNRFRGAVLAAALALACPAFATVTGNPPPVSYSCNGTTITYTIGFPYLATSNVVATVTTGAVVSTLTIGTDYTVSPSTAPSVGTLTLTAGSKCPNGSTLTLTRNTPLTQPQSFRTGPYSGSAHEQAFDRIEMQLQQAALKEQTDLGVVNNTVAAFNASGAAIGSTTSVLATGSTTPRTLAAWFADTVNVKAFGAKGDWNGTTGNDDTAAIQAAITAAKPLGAWVEFPAGTYHVTAELAVGGQFRVRGSGTITTSVATGAIFVANADLTDFVIRDVKLTTSRNDLVNRAAALVYSDGHNIDGGLVENVRFDSGSSLQSCMLVAAQIGVTLKNITIRNSIFSCGEGLDLLSHADATVRLTNFSIIDNKFVNPGLVDDQVAGYAMSISGGHNGFTVRGNEITGYPYAGIEVVAPSAGGTFTVDDKIVNNTLTSTGRGIIFDASNTADRMRHASVIGNTITASRFFQRFIYLSDSEVIGNHVELISGVTSTDRQNEFVSFRNSDRVNVADNSIYLDMPAAEVTKSVVSFLNWSDSLFSHNYVRTTGNGILRFDGTTTTVSSNTVSGNKLVNASNGVVGDPIAFQGAGAIQNMLDGNTIARTISNTISSATSSNVAQNTVLLRTDTGAISTNDLFVTNVTGAVNLTLQPELRFIRLQGAPGAGFTVTLPSRDGVYTVSNATGQTATITATSGSVSLLTGNTTNVTVQGGAAASF